MTSEELERLLEATEETDVLEFKGPMTWGVGLVKDILAMANVVGGGRIVVGIEDDNLTRVGVTMEQAATFNLDIMRDVVGQYADPPVTLSREIVALGEITFVVITVAPFSNAALNCT